MNSVNYYFCDFCELLMNSEKKYILQFCELLILRIINFANYNNSELLILGIITTGKYTHSDCAMLNVQCWMLDAPCGMRNGGCALRNRGSTQCARVNARFRKGRIIHKTHYNSEKTRTEGGRVFSEL